MAGTCHSSQPDNQEVMGLIPAGLCFASLSVFLKAQVFKAARYCNLNCEKLSGEKREDTIKRREFYLHMLNGEETKVKETMTAVKFCPVNFDKESCGSDCSDV